MTLSDWDSDRYSVPQQARAPVPPVFHSPPSASSSQSLWNPRFHAHPINGVFEEQQRAIRNRAVNLAKVEAALVNEEDEHSLEIIDDLTVVAIPPPSVVKANLGLAEAGLFERVRLRKSPGDSQRIPVRKRSDRVS